MKLLVFTWLDIVVIFPDLGFLIFDEFLSLFDFDDLNNSWLRGCMTVCKDGCIHALMYPCMDACMDAGMHAWMHA